MAPAAKVPYRASPIGISRYVWVNKPDTKFNAEGLYKLGLAPLDGAEAAKFKEQIDEAAGVAFNEETADMTAGERKKWSLYVPYTEEEDDEGNPTGRIWFQFKQNATIKLRDGTVKEIQIGIFDAADKRIALDVYGGSTVRVMYRPRAVRIATNKQAGVRLDFCKVQVIQLAERGSEGGFGGVEDGYVHDDAEDQVQDGGSAAGGGADSGDY